jgi:uncharacterized protein
MLTTLTDENRMNTQSQDTRPWYKEPIMWLVCGIPVIAIGWGGVMITLAVSSKDSLVSDSYYKDGVSFTENVEMDNKAKRLQVKAQLVFTNDEVRIHLDGYFDQYPDVLSLQLIHPTLQDQDSTVLLQRTADGNYVGLPDITLPSRRHIWLQSPEQGWRIRLTDTIQPDQVIQLNAQ